MKATGIIKSLLAAVTTFAGFFSCLAVEEEPLCMLKYLRTSGAQYVDLDYYPTPKTTVVYDFYAVGDVDSEQGHFGSWGGSTDFSFYSCIRSTKKHAWGYSAKTTRVAAPCGVGRWKIELNGPDKKVEMWQDGVSMFSQALTAAGSQTASLSMYLFSVHTDGSTSVSCERNIAFYGMQIYEDGALVRDLKPCKTKDLEVAVYDTLTKTVYRNASGRGAFVAGPVEGSLSGDVHLQPRGVGLDDTEAIIEKLNGLGGDDTLYLDEGEWNVSSTIVIPSGATLSGVGQGKTIVRYAAGGLLKGFVFELSEESTLKNLTLKGNGAFSKTDDCLGAVCVRGSFTASPKVEGLAISEFCCDYTNFRADGPGSAMRLFSAATVRDCIISNNQTSATAAYAGYYPGIRIESTSKLTLVEKCVISKNKRTDGNQLAYSAPIIAAGGTVRNCLIADNTSARASGVYATGSARIVNCTIANNTCSASSDATQCAACYGSANVEFVNCLVTGNKGSTGVLTPTNTTSTAKFERLCTEEPTYRDASNGDYYVVFGSSINAGINEDWMADATDIVGAKRILEGQADIGCYEFVPAGLSCQIEPLTATRGAGTLPVRFRATVKGVDLEGLVYHWAFEKTEGYDLEGENLQEPEWTFGPGRYAVRLHVTNAAGESADNSQDVEVFVAYGAVYVSTDSVPTEPYDTPAKAAADFDTLLALDLVGDGTEIRVCPGTYSLAATIEPACAVRIVSTDGPDVTTLRAASDGCQLVSLSKPGQVLAGLTLTGSSVRGASVSEGTVTNCVFHAFSVDAADCIDGGAALHLGTRAVVVDCLFRKNKFIHYAGYNRHGGVIYAAGRDIAIERCAFTNNWFGTRNQGDQTMDHYGIAVYLNGSGRIRNSLFAKNSTWNGSWDRGKADYRTIGTIALFGAGPIQVDNCTVADNLAEGSACSGIYCDDATDATIENTILHGNCKSTGEATDLRVSAAEPSNTKLVTNLVDTEPKFRNRAKGDYRLRSTSPAWNAGTKEGWMEHATDLIGAPRILQGTVDIGCFETLVKGLLILIH